MTRPGIRAWWGRGGGAREQRVPWHWLIPLMPCYLVQAVRNQRTGEGIWGGEHGCRLTAGGKPWS